jgi:hypothetical protein
LSSSSKGFLGDDSTVCEFECPPGVKSCVNKDGTQISKNTIGFKIGTKKSPHIFELLVGVLIILVVGLVLVKLKRPGESVLKHSWLISASTFSLMLFLLISSFTINLNMRAQYFGDPTKAGNREQPFYGGESGGTTSCLNLPSKYDSKSNTEVKSYKTDTILISLAYVLLAGSVVALSFLGKSGAGVNVDRDQADFDDEFADGWTN